MNLNEYLYKGQALKLLLWPAEEIIFEENETTQSNFSEKKSDYFETKKTKKNVGQPSLVLKFPEIVPEATEFLKQHSFAAECRRRNDTSYSSGVTVSQIREHLIKTIPGLKEHGLSLSTTRRLFQAPDSRFTPRSSYKGFIKARVGVKDNFYRRFNTDAHYLFARNRYRREFAYLFKVDINLISADDMAKRKSRSPGCKQISSTTKIFFK